MLKLAPDAEGLKAMAGQDNKARAEEYCYGREFYRPGEGTTQG